MNTLLTSSPSEGKRVAPQNSLAQSPVKNAWYQGYEMGMAFCRLTEQLSAEPGTKIEKELRCLERILDRDISRHCRQERVNLIDLGTGDGQKMILVIKALNKAGISPVRYVPVDTNPYISRYAILTILGSGKKAWSKEEVELLFGPLGNADFNETKNADLVSIETLVRLSRSFPTKGDFFVQERVAVPATGLEIDFFHNLPNVVTAAKSFNGIGMNIFCLLGNTFGNYSPENQKRFLTTLCGQMEAGELFLLGISLRPKPDNAEEIYALEREYLPGEAFMRLGADHPQSKYSSKYHGDSHRMIHSFERPDRTIQDMGYSYLFDANEVINDIDAAHLEVVSCESYPKALDCKTPSQMDHEPKYLTILVRKPD